MSTPSVRAASSGPNVLGRGSRFGSVLALVACFASPAPSVLAQVGRGDEFDIPSPTITPGQTTAPAQSTPPPPTDTPPAEEATARVVRVIAIREVDVAPPTVTTSCVRARLAVGTARGGVGAVTDDGRFVVVPSATVEGATAIVVHLDTPGDVRAATLVTIDEASGMALVRLARPFDAIASADVPSLDVGTPVSVIDRAADGRLTRESGRILAPMNSSGEIGISVDGYGVGSEPRLIFRQGRLVGVFSGRRAIGGAGLLQSATVATIARLFAEPLATTVPLDPTYVASLERASAFLVRLSVASTSDARCAAVGDARRDEPGVAIDPAAVPDAPARLLFAIDAWNRDVIDEGVTTEPALSSAAYLWVEHADLLGNAAVTDAAFARRLRQRAASERERVRRETAAREERERLENEARIARERRLNRSITYTMGLAAGFARDGSPGLGGALVMGGAFGSLPRLAPTGSFRMAAAVGGSLGFGSVHGGTALLTLDLGTTMRLGGRTGAFVLLAYSPGFVTRRLEGSPFVASSYRAALGMTLGRRVVFAGYRVMAPSGDYPLHLLEFGMAFRHGPMPRSTGSEGTPDTTVAARTRSLD